MHLPLSVTRSGADRVILGGVTQNISSSGVLFTTKRQAEPGGPIEYVIVLSNGGSLSVSLHCMGKVLRADRVSTSAGQEGATFQIAATLERYEFVRS